MGNSRHRYRLLLLAESSTRSLDARARECLLNAPSRLGAETAAACIQKDELWHPLPSHEVACNLRAAPEPRAGRSFKEQRRILRVPTAVPSKMKHVGMKFPDALA
jgi:hypothetical protein